MANKPVLLHNLSKPWNNSRTVQVNERNQSKSKTKSRTSHSKSEETEQLFRDM